MSALKEFKIKVTNFVKSKHICRKVLLMSTRGKCGVGKMFKRTRISLTIKREKRRKKADRQEEERTEGGKRRERERNSVGGDDVHFHPVQGKQGPHVAFLRSSARGLQLSNRLQH